MRGTLAAALTATALATPCGCGPAPQPVDAPNVVLVSVDTLRADALGVYGGPVATPAFDALARQGVLFESAVAPASETAPSHATLLTGREVPHHGVGRNGTPLPEEVGTLAQSFSSAGYVTGAFVSSFVLDPRFGWGRGFDRYDAEFTAANQTFTQRRGEWAEYDIEAFDRRAEDTNLEALAWLAGAEEPFFLFVHYFDPHAPYTSPAGFLERVPTRFARAAARERIASTRGATRMRPDRLGREIRRYQAEVLYVDQALGALFAALEARGVAGRTLFVVTADHGEGLGQHGFLHHTANVYEEQIRVPLLFRWPGRIVENVRIRTPVGLVDVAPTIASLAGVATPRESDGRALGVSLLEGAEPEPRAIFGGRWRFESSGGRLLPQLFVRRDHWKYIRTPETEELYDLDADPGEHSNVLHGHTGMASALREELGARLAEAPGILVPSELSEETRRALRALGYLD